MNLPNLPTDNLYKFIALSGLFMSAFFTSLLVYQEREMYRVQTDAELRFKTYLTKAQMLQSMSEIAKTAKLPTDSPDNLEIWKTMIQPMNEQIIKMGQEAMKEFREDSQVFVDTATNRAMMEAWNWPLRVGIDTGGAIAIVGFLLWYFRLQRHQDEIVRNEVARGRLLQTSTETDRTPEPLNDGTPVDIRPKKVTVKDHPS